MILVATRTGEDGEGRSLTSERMKVGSGVKRLSLSATLVKGVSVEQDDSRVLTDVSSIHPN